MITNLVPIVPFKSFYLHFLVETGPIPTSLEANIDLVQFLTSSCCASLFLHLVDISARGHCSSLAIEEHCLNFLRGEEVEKAFLF